METSRKYELTKKTKTVSGHKLHQIRALRDIPGSGIYAGDVGGWIESEENLSQNGEAWVTDEACVFGKARVSGEAIIESNNDYIVFKNFWSSGRYLTWTRSNNMFRVGCFYGTGDELIAKAYKDSEVSGREYGRVVKYIQSILDDEEKGGEK